MGCCSGRIQKPMEDPNLIKIKQGHEIVDKTYFSSVASNYISNKNNYYRKNFNVASVDSKHLNQELEELSFIRSNVNLEKLLKLLSSNTKITMDEDVVLHSWAENPKTIGTLATIQLGIFASDKDISHESSFTDAILKTGIVDKLLEFINSQERDKFEAAVLAISFLSENNADIVETLIKKNALPALIRHMRDPKEGLKGTAALCCRNLYVARPSVQQEFIQEQGSGLLIKLLRSEDSVTVFETILNLLDLILDDEDTIQQDVKQHLQSFDIVDELDRIIFDTSRYEQDTINEAVKLKMLFN
ncbi:unnamed protein product [Blepharisma stoltei]|uniref:Uncharacterized protein n=1 Tax=Blepharisma stoltei TaxID=1481888 RepID=A0AAU9JA30_9CILI|nr:unnamed protein product [Blepharisma stoltei]